MNILVCSPAFRYGDRRSLEPALEWTLGPLKRMGHQVRLFNLDNWHPVESDWMNERFIELVRTRGYDFILICSWDMFDVDVLEEAKRHAVVATWNPDDDWRWDITSKMYPHFSYMLTFSRPVYETHKADMPNLLLTQWACTGTYDGIGVPKTIPVSFVGQPHGDRFRQIKELRKVSKVVTFGTMGFGGRFGDDGGPKWRVRRFVAQKLSMPLIEAPLNYDDMNDIWSRTKISFSPLEASQGGVLQMKARLFEMGTSGTLMICNHYKYLDEFYERGVEYEDYENLDECKEKIKFYLKHEAARHKIAEAYNQRTRDEHIWEHRYRQLFERMGLPVYGNNVG